MCKKVPSEGCNWGQELSDGSGFTCVVFSVSCQCTFRVLVRRISEFHLKALNGLAARIDFVLGAERYGKL